MHFFSYLCTETCPLWAVKRNLFNPVTMKKLLFLVCAALLMASCGKGDKKDAIEGEANNPVTFFECTFGDNVDDVLESLKGSNKTYKVGVDDVDNPTEVTLTPRKKGLSIKYKNTNYEEAKLGFARDEFSRIALRRVFADKASFNKFVKRHDSNPDALSLDETDSTRTFVIKGEESRCSVFVDVPQQQAVISYTDNAVLKRSNQSGVKTAWDDFIDFMTSPFDNLWSLLVWCIILGVIYWLYKKYGQGLLD